MISIAARIKAAVKVITPRYGDALYRLLTYWTQIIIVPSYRHWMPLTISCIARFLSEELVLFLLLTSVYNSCRIA
ncbi:hypothetical protein CEXT_763191 [Caerostris extrusa]|uniref:Uncharacterized protein n=1 Tax=Caerostris extrusa TaxID=172846 RepID=A0AAV4MQR8_CAEEX|nr:hypothetical protein CEXT_763191 [Caerostris extrusa]